MIGHTISLVLPGLSGLAFSTPAYLSLLLLALPVVAALWYLNFRSHLTARRRYGDERLVSRFSGRLRLLSQFAPLLGWLVATVLIVLAAAGPQLALAPEKVQAGSLQVVAVFDVSKSAGAEDYRSYMPSAARLQFVGQHGSRLDAGKYVLESEIMPAIADNQLGIVTYQGKGFAQGELTDDFQALSFVLDNWVVLGGAPGGGSDYASGLQAAVDMFNRNKEPNASRVIVMFSDGGFTGDQSALTKVESELKTDHIKLIVVGVGLSTPVPIPQYDPVTGQFQGNFQENGKTAQTSIDESTLRQLAAASGGQYLHLGTDLHVGVNWPSSLAGRAHTETHPQDVFQYPLFAGMLLVFLLTVARRLKLWRRLSPLSLLAEISRLHSRRAEG